MLPAPGYFMEEQHEDPGARLVAESEMRLKAASRHVNASMGAYNVASKAALDQGEHQAGINEYIQADANLDNRTQDTAFASAVDSEAVRRWLVRRMRGTAWTVSLNRSSRACCEASGRTPSTGLGIPRPPGRTGRRTMRRPRPPPHARPPPKRYTSC